MRSAQPSAIGPRIDCELCAVLFRTAHSTVRCGDVHEAQARKKENKRREEKRKKKRKERERKGKRKEEKGKEGEGEKRRKGRKGEGEKRRKGRKGKKKREEWKKLDSASVLMRWGYGKAGYCSKCPRPRCLRYAMLPVSRRQHPRRSPNSSVGTKPDGRIDRGWIVVSQTLVG